MEQIVTLVNHDPAPYQHDENNKLSYFALLQDENGVLKVQCAMILLSFQKLWWLVKWPALSMSKMDVAWLRIRRKKKCLEDDVMGLPLYDSPCSVYLLPYCA